MYQSLPSGLGLHPVPWWWPLPVLAVAGVLAAVAIVRLPGHGGHIPYEGIKAGTAEPAELPGILLAALATLGLGLVLGPEAPLIALGGGLAILAVQRARKDTPDQVMAVLAASAAFAAIATIFGSPVIGAIHHDRGRRARRADAAPDPAAGPDVGRDRLGHLHRHGPLDRAQLQRLRAEPLHAARVLPPHRRRLRLGHRRSPFAAALATFAIIEGARWSAGVVARQPWLLLPAAALAVAGLAIGFAQITHQPADVVLFSGQDAFSSLIKQGPTLALSTLAFLLLFKGAGLEHLAGQLPRRPDLPGPVPRRGRADCSPRTCPGSPRPPPWPC